MGLYNKVLYLMTKNSLDGCLVQLPCLGPGSRLEILCLSSSVVLFDYWDCRFFLIHSWNFLGGTFICGLLPFLCIFRNDISVFSYTLTFDSWGQQWDFPVWLLKTQHFPWHLLACHGLWPSSDSWGFPLNWISKILLALESKFTKGNFLSKTDKSLCIFIN